MIPIPLLNHHLSVWKWCPMVLSPTYPSLPSPNQTGIHNLRCSVSCIRHITANISVSCCHIQFSSKSKREDTHLYPTRHCNGVVHSVTKETITRYYTLARVPVLWYVWQKAMCKDLEHSAQEYKGTEDTITMCILTNDQIRQIHKDRTVIYAWVVVDYRLWKANQNHVRITDGVNLINYL